IVYVHNTSAGPGLWGYSASGYGLQGSSASGHGVYADSSGSGLAGSALYAKNTSDSGVSLWAHNSSPSNTNATLALSNDGSGDLLKGFGGDGGEDEFRFKNDGTFQNKQPSYIFVPGSDAFLYGNGAALISYGNYSWVDPSTTGTKTVFVSATLPSVLYGQGVEVEEVRIYYATTDSASYIDYTSVDVMNNLGIYAQMVGDSLNHDSTAVSSYGLIPTSYQFFSADLGFLSVKLDLYFANASHIIQIIGVRIKLRHHPLY
ncbi:MAG: hypothetical protein JXB15_16835, partial [Anaerolineales bacterium]|nr:hypothetical protein [Anaerolineales bacterium]